MQIILIFYSICLVNNVPDFNASGFNPKLNHEFNAIRNGISDGKIYVSGTKQSVTNSLKLARQVRYANYGLAGLGFILSVKEYNQDKISAQILALDGVMGLASLTGSGTPYAAVYFVLIRSDTKDQYFRHQPENIYNSSRVQIDNTRTINKNIIR